MMNLKTRHARSLGVALALAFAAPMYGWCASAAPVPPVPAKQSTAEPPSPSASGTAGSPTACTNRQDLCAALRAANKALIAAAKANRKGAYVCTSLDHQPGCGTGPPQAYLTPSSPYGNPSDVERGRRLLDWYLTNLTCEALCQPKQDAQACVQACGEGKDPKSFPSGTGSSAKPGSAPKVR